MSDDDVVARITDDAYVAALASLSLEDLRDRRDECDAAEMDLSYRRRVMQGRIDILRDELAVRGDGRRSSVADLVERLPGILADVGEPSVRGSVAGVPSRHAHRLAPAVVAGIDRDIDVMMGFAMSEAAEADDEHLEAAAGRLSTAEREVSKRRRAVQQTLDAVLSEIASRYRDTGRKAMAPDA